MGRIQTSRRYKIRPRRPAQRQLLNAFFDFSYRAVPSVFILFHSPEFPLREHPLKPKRQVQMIRNRVFPINVQCCTLPGRQNLIFGAVDDLACVTLPAVFIPRVDKHEPQIVLCSRCNARHADNLSVGTDDPERIQNLAERLFLKQLQLRRTKEQM